MGVGRGCGWCKAHLIPYIWDKFTLDRKNITIIAFDEPISKKLSPDTRTDNMVSSHR